MSDVIKMDYAMMADMKQQCQKGAEVLDDTLHEVKKIAGMLDQDGLIGMAGDAFVNALEGSLSKKVIELRDKLEEVARDIQNAVDAMQEADANAQSEMGR